MPEISYLNGISIHMRFENEDRHSLPHIHLFYSGSHAVMSVIDGTVLGVKGNFNPGDLNKVAKWCKSNTDALLKNWDLCIKHKIPEKINPHR